MRFGAGSHVWTYPLPIGAMQLGGPHRGLKKGGTI